MRLSLITAVSQLAALLGFGLYLLASGLEHSWLDFSPPGSNVWYRVFQPYWVELLPGILFLGTAIVVVLAHLISARRWPGPSTEALGRDLSTANLVVGAAVLVSYPFFAIGTICAYPGGCHVVLIVYWPLVAPAIVLLVLGAVGRWGPGRLYGQPLV